MAPSSSTHAGIQMAKSWLRSDQRQRYPLEMVGRFQRAVFGSAVHEVLDFKRAGVLATLESKKADL